jgi:hypothetical protein
VPPRPGRRKASRGRSGNPSRGGRKSGSGNETAVESARFRPSASTPRRLPALARAELLKPRNTA